MKVSVVKCSCANPKPHLKLETANGQQSRGFFSIDEGRALHDTMIASGDAEQTVDEEAATVQEIESCGLPQNDPETLPPSPPLSDETIRLFAEMLVQAVPADEFSESVLAGYAVGAFNREDGKKILAIARSMSQQT